MSTCTRHFIPLLMVIAFFLNVTIVSAQTEQDREILREEFRTALLSDPRAANLSETELTSMVDALAQEAETQGAVVDFVLPPVPPLPEFVEEYVNMLITPWGQPIDPITLYGIILLCLACAGLLLWWLLHLHRQPAVH